MFLNKQSQDLKRLVSLAKASRYLCSPGQRGDRPYQLPWPDIPQTRSEPVLHRMAGLFLIKRLVNQSGGKFMTHEFLEGAKSAVETIAEVLSRPEKRSLLDTILHPRLHEVINTSIHSLPPSTELRVEIDRIRDLRLAGINSIVGKVEDPSDRHVVAWMGQKIIASKSGLEIIISSDGRFTSRLAREVGKEAALTRILFLLSVSFRTRERFLVTDVGTGRTVRGSDSFRNAFHVWRFGSEVLWDEGYPFQWRVYDINGYLESCDMLYE